MPRAHPAKGHLAVRRDTNKKIAALYGCNPIYLGRVLNGRDKPPARMRQWLSDYLGVPESELFHDDDELVGGAR